MTDFFGSKVTIYINIPATALKPRYWVRRVIDLCNVQSGFVDKVNGTVRNVVNAISVITKDVKRYVSPTEFYSIPEDLRTDNVYTVQTDDFVVFDVVEDVVETNVQFSDLQSKYKNNGMKIVSVNPSINGLAVDNITFRNA